MLKRLAIIVLGVLGLAQYAQAYVVHLVQQVEVDGVIVETIDEMVNTGDGIGFARELELGYNPHFADEWQRGIVTQSQAPQFFKLIIRSEPEGVLFETETRNVAPGVRYALSQELEVDLQPFEQMRGTIVDGEYEELFTSPLAGNEGTSAAFGAAASPLAADVNGDGLFDLVTVSLDPVRARERWLKTRAFSDEKHCDDHCSMCGKEFCAVRTSRRIAAGVVVSCAPM